MTEVFVRGCKTQSCRSIPEGPYNDSTLLVIYDTVSDIPDIIILQVIEFVSITSLHLTCVPFLLVVAVKLKLVVSPELLLTKAAVNPYDIL